MGNFQFFQPANFVLYSKLLLTAEKLTLLSINILSHFRLYYDAICIG